MAQNMQGWLAARAGIDPRDALAIGKRLTGEIDG